MTQEKMYRYIGKNGTITSFVLLEGISHIPMIKLKADNGYILTDGVKEVYSIAILPEEIDEWTEIPDELNK